MKAGPHSRSYRLLIYFLFTVPSTCALEHKLQMQLRADQ